MQTATGDDCGWPAPICEAADHVIRIAAFDPIGSAVALGDGLFVTNRHVVADFSEITVFQDNDTTLRGKVIPTAYPGDLILFEVKGFGPKKGLPMAVAGKKTLLQVIGADPSVQTIRINDPGRPIQLPVKDKPASRLHHDAQSGAGNSGGAVVDGRGRLVGIMTSGGEGRNEAIPAGEIARLKALSGDRYAKESERIGLATRQCAERIDRVFRGHAIPDGDALERIKVICLESGNRQFIDLAGQIMGRAGRTGDAIDLFQRSLDEDPYAPNALVSMAISLHLGRRYSEEIPYLERLMELMPADPQVLRLALQAGRWGGDEDLAKEALLRIEAHHGALAPAARHFLENEPRP
ncbi:MAG: trypsin-like peptidase domain-containing protein [Rhodospirillales bacterium]